MTLVTVPVAAGRTEPAAPVMVLVTAGTTDLVTAVTVPVTAGSVLPVTRLTVLVTAGRALLVLPVAAGSAVLVTLVTALVTVGWAAAATLAIALVRPDSGLAGFGPGLAGVGAGGAGVVWVLPVSAPVTVDAALVAVGCALAVRWLTAPVTLATVDAGVAGGGLATWLPAGCAAAGCAPGGCAAAGCAGAGWVWADGDWRLPRPGVTLLTAPVTLLTALARPLAAGGCEPGTWPAPLGLAVADGWAGATGWLAG
ncbi:MAG: hypothetical protein ACLPKI_30730 [Streptosporangiaceae bacterium]